jgi:CRISPR/Cas system CSM-associated protein Csm3 (group 7 of RAMP superfamily)
MTDYTRVAIKGRLKTLTRLHIGNGDEAPIDPLGEETTNTVLLDARGKPYLPASTLRGYLRSRISDNAQRKKIFGNARQRRGETESGNIGQLRIYDAPIALTDWRPTHISRTSIDPLTATAREHHLSTHEVVEPNVVFDLHLELDETDSPSILSLLQALASFNDSASGRLGKGKSIGQGRMEWSLDKVEVLTQEKFIQWLCKTPDTAQSTKTKKGRKKAGQSQANTSVLLPDRGYRNHWSEITTQFRDISSQSHWKTFDLRLIPTSPILINDPHLVRQQQGNNPSNEESAPQPPDAIFMRQGDKALIPASSLKGWTRGQCRRILLTLTQNRSIQTVESLLARLFGSTETGQGCLRFEDARADFDANQLHRQTFNAVDRFTGGVKKSALYNVEAVWPDNFTTQLHYDPTAMEDWMKPLLLYLLRDAMEGDLVLGWGKSKGYGRLVLTQNQIDIEGFDSQILETWHRRLSEKLTETENVG